MNETYLSQAQLVCFGLLDSFSIGEVAQKLDIDERTIRDWIAKGDLTAFNVSRNRDSRKPRLRISDDEIERFLQSRSTAPAPTSVRRRTLPPVGNWDL